MLIQAIENQVFRKAAPMAVRYLDKPDLSTRDPLARRVLEQMEREFQLAPPLTIHLGDPVLMAGAWAAAREAYVVGASGRAVREAVAAVVSRLNQCPYCVDVHTGMLASAGGDTRMLHEPSALPEPFRSACEWAGATLTPARAASFDPGVARDDRPKLFATAIVFHYLNRLVSVFLGETPVALPGARTALGRKLVHASFGWLGKRIVRLDPQPGRFVHRPDAALPPEFAWAESDSPVAGALAGFAHAAEQAGRESVPEPVRRLVLDHLAAWQGETAPLSRGGGESLVAPLDGASRPSARLALLCARAAYQVDDGVIERFGEIEPDDRALLRTVAWASFAAARRIGSWFPAR